eukprot:3721650-Amphidinium_carterae.1
MTHMPILSLLHVRWEFGPTSTVLVSVHLAGRRGKGSAHHQRALLQGSHECDISASTRWKRTRTPQLVQLSTFEDPVRNVNRQL